MLFGVMLMLQRSQFTHRDGQPAATRRERNACSSEQQAIFQSASQGIAVVSGGHIVKCNHRLGEMLGRRLQELVRAGFRRTFR